MAVLGLNAEGSAHNESAFNAGDLGLTPGLGRSPGEGNSYPPQYSCLENPMDRGAWQATVHGLQKNQIRLSSVQLLVSFQFGEVAPFART